MTPSALPAMLDALRHCRSREDYLAAMAHCRIAVDDIAPFCQYGDDAYQRNPIERNERHELVAICWRHGQATPIHNHGQSQCCVRVLQGTIEEQRYVRDDAAGVTPTAGGVQRLTPRAETRFDAAEDFHRLTGLHPDGSISLHLYVPPLADYETFELP
jgi:cysteine dioxygenase